MTKLTSWTIPIAAATVLAAAADPAMAAQREVRIGSAPTLPPRSSLVAGLASLKTMQIAVALAPRDPVALVAYAKGVADPNSPEFRDYLTPSQFRARFAPSRRTLSRVEAELRRHGLHPGSVSSNGLAIHVRAGSAAIEHAFGLTLMRTRLTDGRDAVYNNRAPAVDANVAPSIQAVIGLSNLTTMQRLDIMHTAAAPKRGAAAVSGDRVSTAHLATGGPQPCAKASQVAPGENALTADQIATAYGLPAIYGTGDQGQGVTVGLYELEPNLPSDIAAYQQCYRTHTQVSYVPVDGGVHAGTGQGEAALDIEQLIGLAPKAKLLVYQGPNNNSDNPGTGPYDTLAKMIDQDQVQVISVSWGECETLEGRTDALAENTLLEEAATQGQTFLVAAGDSGSEDCWSPPPGGNTNNTLAVDDPASQPFATAVGGTTLSSIGPPPSETVWDDDNPQINYSRLGVQQGAGGGGISSLWPMPSFQTATPAALGVINPISSGAPCGAATGSYCRELPDVSADADPMTPYLTYWNGKGSNHRGLSGWQGTGGTSGAAPVWAALIALADASRACSGTLIGWADPALYELAGQSQATYFNDIVATTTSSNNDFTPSGNTSGQYPATPGYDMATGLGTPKAGALIPALCAQAVKVGYPGQVYTFYGQHVRLRLQARLAAGQTGTVSFRALHLPAGVHIDAATGVVSGTVDRAGVRTVAVTASSSAGTYGTIRFTWAVERRPHVSAAVHGTSAMPALTITTRSGAFEPGLRQLIIALPRSVTLAGSARDVQVLSTNGRRLAHSAHYAGQVLTVRLAAAHSPVRVVFPSGSLRVRGRLARAARVAVRTVDRVGGHITISRPLTGA